jgi:hypothetical protein
MSSGLWRYVFIWVGSDVSEESSAFVFKGKAPQKEILKILDCLTLEDECITITRNVKNHSLNDTASICRKSGSPQLILFVDNFVQHEYETLICSHSESYISGMI